MQKERIQNKVCCSRFLLPVCWAVMMLLWLLPEGKFSLSRLFSFLLYSLTTYFLLETNNANALIRVRSRSASSLFLIFVGCIGFLHEFHPSAIATCCMALSYYLLIRTYQAHEPVVDVFHSFVLLGAATIFLPQALLFIPFYFWYLIVFMRSFSFRCMWSGLIGFALPMWFGFNILFITDRLSLAEDWWDTLCNIQPVTRNNYLAIPHDVALCWCVVALFALWTGSQYLTHKYNDKIRTRMCHYIFLMQSFVLLVVSALQPHLAKNLLPLALVSAIPYMAHYFTLTRTIFCNLWFILLFLALTAMGLLTLSGGLLPIPLF